MAQRQYEHLIFDLDGTLVDSEEATLRQLAHALEEFGHPVDSWRDLTVGWSNAGPRAAIQKVLHDRETELHDQVLNRYLERFLTHAIQAIRCYPGTLETLASLRESGYTLHIATSRSHYNALHILEGVGISHYFRSTCGTVPGGSLDNKADLLALLLGREKLDAEECVMIGDREFDINAARANSMDSIGVLHGYGSREELEAASAGVIVEDLLAVARMFI